MALDLRSYWLFVKAVLLILLRGWLASSSGLKLVFPSGCGTCLSLRGHLVVRTTPPTSIKENEIHPKYSAGPQCLLSCSAPSSGWLVWWHVQAVGMSSRIPDKTKTAPEAALIWPCKGNQMAPLAPRTVAKTPVTMEAVMRAFHVQKFPESDNRVW